ncbi:carboxypeptidase-like regulatory domain-containing protein [Hymenobacter sp. BT186]|uniref:Carboxypeptidase-like regulatory domain-containing protein n=1 Tax=Hymenobacter telluris TaxID=2816474 RepID=A0A939J8B6_9BACT|nr:carboxypeptidase-like regulatory domain-containing protein [Hymenobacter telluris]MBO0357579.1 carboxypeptidase-like regulatory domain-containing protein [Hymenobacter telluris]MBW3373605.1 carboxypeptidase-like regulatory domain-containing protein [Hymenobacter norwichensis]
MTFSTFFSSISITRYWQLGWLAGCLLMLLLPLSAAAQVRVSGSVLEAGTQRPVPGAAVLVQRSGRGVVADAEGDFRIEVQPTDTLVFRAVGFKTRRVPLGGTGLSQLVVQVALMRDSILLGEVRVTEGRPDRAAINKALRNIKRPSTAPTSAVKRPPAPKPLFPIDSTAPKAPVPTLASPVSLIYDQFSRAGKERRKMEEIQAAEAAEKARKARQKYNKNFKDNRGYEP